MYNVNDLLVICEISPGEINYILQLEESTPTQ